MLHYFYVVIACIGISQHQCKIIVGEMRVALECAFIGVTDFVFVQVYGLLAIIGLRNIDYEYLFAINV